MNSTIDEINLLRKRILAGEDPSAEEMQRVITQLRSERTGASETTAKKREPAKPVDLAALFAKKPEAPDE